MSSNQSDNARGDWLVVAEFRGPPPEGYPADGVADVKLGVVTDSMVNYTCADALAEGRAFLTRLPAGYERLRVVVVPLEQAIIEEVGQPASPWQWSPRLASSKP